MEFNEEMRSKSKKFERQNPKPGASTAYLVRVVGLGLQSRKNPTTGDNEIKSKINFTYELSRQFMKDENGAEDKTRPFWVSEQFNVPDYYSVKSFFFQRLKAIDPDKQSGNGVSWKPSNMLGMPCTVTIEVNETPKGVYSNVKGVSGVPEELKEVLTKPVNEVLFFDFYKPTKESWASLYDWERKVIRGAVDYVGSEVEKIDIEYQTSQPKESKKVEDDKKPEQDDDIPF